jgi:hypothetical protein
LANFNIFINNILQILYTFILIIKIVKYIKNQIILANFNIFINNILQILYTFILIIKIVKYIKNQIILANFNIFINNILQIKKIWQNKFFQILNNKNIL